MQGGAQSRPPGVSAAGTCGAAARGAGATSAEAGPGLGAPQEPSEPVESGEDPRVSDFGSVSDDEISVADAPAAGAPMRGSTMGRDS